MDQIDQREKTLVFCATQGHAALVRDLINQMKTSSDPNYCVRVTADDGELGDQWLRTFQDNEKTIPTILTTSQKLSTGVDARNVRNIVLMRPISTMIEFKQIIGRGTRLFDGKDYFTIYDFVKAYEHFNDPEWDGEPLEPDAAGAGAGGRGEPQPSPDEPGRDDRRSADGRRSWSSWPTARSATSSYIAATTFWAHDGKPISAQRVHGPAVRRLARWSPPKTSCGPSGATRAPHAFIQRLVELGYDADRIEDMRRLIDAPNSDIFDVLAYVRFTLAPLTRSQRAEAARSTGLSGYGRMREFLNSTFSRVPDPGSEN